MRGFNIKTLLVTVGLVGTLVVATACGADDAGAGAQDAATSGSPSVTTASVSPSASPSNDVAPSATPSATQTSQSASPSPTRSWPAAIATTVKLDKTTHKPGGGYKTAITLITCELNPAKPISGIYIEGKGSNNSAPYGDVRIGPNSATSIELTHTILQNDATYAVNIGCGYVEGGYYDWEYEFQVTLKTADSGKARRITCDGKKPACYVDGFR